VALSEVSSYRSPNRPVLQEGRAFSLSLLLYMGCSDGAQGSLAEVQQCQSSQHASKIHNINNNSNYLNTQLENLAVGKCLSRG
jgi:hypothetical protein